MLGAGGKRLRSDNEEDGNSKKKVELMKKKQGERRKISNRGEKKIRDWMKK